MHNARTAVLSLLSAAGLAVVASCTPAYDAETAPGMVGDNAAPPAAGGFAGASNADPFAVAVIDGKEVPAPRITMGDPGVIMAIAREGKANSRVMEHMDYLSRSIGPRLTGSARAKQANDWLAENYRKWGLTNVAVEEWGTVATQFDRGPCTGKVFTKLAPQRRRGGGDEAEKPPEWEVGREMQFSTLSWSRGTEGPVRGPLVRMPTTDAEYEAIKPKLKGAWVLQSASTNAGMRAARARIGAKYEQHIEARKAVKEGQDPATLKVIEERMLFDGIAGIMSTSRDERVWTGAVPGWRERAVADVPPDILISIRLSDYDYLNSRLTDGDTVEVEFDLKHTLTAGPAPAYNTIAEIRGTEWPEQVVIVSAHADSWDGPGSQGTTDNGTGTAVTLEAARILAACKVKPKRTIRFVHWTGEEQGLLGSRAYVKARSAEMDNISCCFVDDGGTNYQGGLGCAEQMVPLLAAATAPVNWAFPELKCNIHGAGRTIPTHGSSDHASFNAVGVPGFYWDEKGRADYQYGWHTQHDKFELAIPEYLVQSATCSAITAYNLACCVEMMPRADKPAPRPERPAGERGAERPAGERGAERPATERRAE